MRYPVPAKDMFERLVVAETDDCVMWPYSLTSNGYGRVQESGAGSRFLLTHREALRRREGEPPTPTHQAAHAQGCPKSCMNYRHLRWATAAENAADRNRDGTHNKGIQNGNARLTDAQVREIRRLASSGVRYKRIASMFDIKENYVGRIYRRAARKDVR